MSIIGVIIEISGGNKRNHHFYLRDAQFLFPPSVIGGGNESEKADEDLTVEFVPGPTIRTDIAGDKMILRNRAAVREFFDRAAINEGDRIAIERVDRAALRISKFSAGSR